MRYIFTSIRSLSPRQSDPLRSISLFNVSASDGPPRDLRVPTRGANLKERNNFLGEGNYTCVYRFPSFPVRDASRKRSLQSTANLTDIFFSAGAGGGESICV